MTRDRLLKGLYRGEIRALQEIITMLEYDSIIFIPEGATNGDMIKAMFPDKELWQTITSICLSTFDHNHAEIYNSSWWNSPYRKEQE